MKVPLVDLRASLTPIREELFRRFEQTLDDMQLFLGPNVRGLEQEFAAYCEVEHGLGVSSGTDALSLAFRALDIGPGDEVIVPSLTFFATIEAVVHVGATPVMVDVTPDTLTIDPEAIAAVLSDRTKAIVPVHLFGHPADMDPILEIAADRDLRVVEDCAQAHGARYRGRCCGSMGDVGTFSFYFTKNLGGFGEGGFVTTNRADLSEAMGQIRNHGHVSKFEHARIGYNYRLDEMQAVILRLKLPHLESNNKRRLAIANRYDDRLRDVAELPTIDDGCRHVYHLYPIRISNRDALRDHLEQRGIGTGIHYRIPGHRQAALRDVPHRIGSMAVTDHVCTRLLSIPIFPEMTDEQVEYVGDTVLAFGRG
ncbi:MAG: erythromycin biosynthesis sensory transduction protein eryC1 [Phycisphaeraceae bacterium]|nr:erythromycin biosynthesis sensory transduction protein eryC1 [Phycisphaeraceae bacterium]